MSHICPTDQTRVEDPFCSRRYKKAIDNPNDDSMLACRDCELGVKAYQFWNIGPGESPPSFNNKTPKKKPVKKVKPKETNMSGKRANKLCPKCGKEARSNVQRTCECGYVFF